MLDDRQHSAFQQVLHDRAASLVALARDGVAAKGRGAVVFDYDVESQTLLAATYFPAKQLPIDMALQRLVAEYRTAAEFIVLGRSADDWCFEMHRLDQFLGDRWRKPTGAVLLKGAGGAIEFDATSWRAIMDLASDLHWSASDAPVSEADAMTLSEMDSRALAETLEEGLAKLVDYDADPLDISFSSWPNLDAYGWLKQRRALLKQLIRFCHAGRFSVTAADRQANTSGTEVAPSPGESS